MITLKRLRIESFKLLGKLDLVFPRQGSVLVEGLNESGKSTLFESVFFALYGTPLVTEGRGRGNLESTIRYGEDSMSVDLVLEVDETELEVLRTVKRNRPSQAKLFVRVPGAQEEQVTGVLAVNARIVDELGGLDGEALLNSCFVEQKKLSKLEDLASSQRKDSLRKLLNLDRLTALAEKFRVTAQDERALAEAKGRLELAEVAAALPAVTAERSSLEASMRGEREGKERKDWKERRTASTSGSTGPVGRGLVPRRPGGEEEGRGAALTPALSQGEREQTRLSQADVGNGGEPGSGGSGGEILRFAQDDRTKAQDDSVAGQGGSVADRDGSVGDEWQATAERLNLVRRAAGEAKRRATAWVLGAAMVAALALIAALLGVTLALWGLLLVPVLGLLAWRSRQSESRQRREAARLAADLSTHRDTMVARSGELEARRRRVEETLGVEGSELDLEECRRDVERLSRQIQVKRTAAAIVEGTMERIVRMVLPNTERNLGQILPLLTAGRYHEARIGEDYQVKVWDDSAGRYVSKGIFSGGAKDQFSLALRLAFALATLPEELGTTPGFIFLDEPLSSFDGPRTEALVRLLTEGQVAANFSQIFVISHNRSFNLNAFQYRLVLRDGRVVESNLPGEGREGQEGREGRGT